MTQRAAEHRVLQRPGERARGVELPLKIESGDESPDRADVDPAGCYGERLERQSRAAETDFPFPPDLALGPSRNERVTERPRGLDLQGAHRPVDDRLSRQAAVEGQRIDVDAGEIEREILRAEVALSQRHQPGVGGAERGHVPRKPPLAEGEIERPQLNLEQPPAVGRDRHAAVQHRMLGEPRIEKPDVGQRRRVGAHREIPEQRVARPLHRALRAELRAGESDAGQIDVERMAVDRQAADDVGDRQPGIAALGREPQHVDPNAVLPRRLDAQRGEPRVEMLEAAQPIASVFTGVFDLLVGTRHDAVLLQPQRE